MSDKHTATPWRAAMRQGSWDYVIVSPDPNIEICQMFYDGSEENEVGQANAEFIVTACNSFDSLLAACKLALNAFERNDAIDWNILADAIALAEKPLPDKDGSK